MNTEHIQYTYALEFRDRINLFVTQEPDIEAYFVRNGYNFWQAFQTEIFVHTKFFSANPEKILASMKQESRVSVKSALFLSLVTSMSVLYAWVRKPRVMVYSRGKSPQGAYGCDFRLQELYQALTEKNVRYVEIMQLPSAARLIHLIRKSKRLPIMNSGFDILYWLGGTRSTTDQFSLTHRIQKSGLFTPSEQIFVAQLFTMLFFKYELAQTRIVWMKKILRLLRVSSVYLIDDMRHYFEILCAGEAESIPTYAIQHGHFTKYHVGMFPYRTSYPGTFIQPRYLLVWSEYWKTELVRLGTFMRPHAIVVAGQKNGVQAPSVEIREMKLAEVGVLVPYETDVSKEHIRPYIDQMVKEGFHIYFKPRNDLRMETQLAEYGVLGTEPYVTVCTDLTHVKSKISVAFGTYTTLMYDLVLMNIPVVLATQVLDYGEGMVRNHLADEVTTVSDVRRIVEKAIAERNVTSKDRMERLLHSDTNKTMIQFLCTELANIR